MTGPDGTRAWGWIDYIDITPEEGFVAVDAFADADGNKDTSMPSTAWTTYFEDAEDGDTQVVTTLTFPTTDAMQTILDMGFEEGFTDALDNLDTLLMTLPQE